MVVGGSTYEFMYVYLSIYVYTYIYIYLSIHLYIYINIYIYIYVHNMRIYSDEGYQAAFKDQGNEMFSGLSLIIYEQYAHIFLKL